jgi:lysophospholipase L1-like esterase
MRQSGVRIYTCCLIVCALMVLSGAVMMGFVMHPQKAQAAAPIVKIMPLGDSITGSPGCWRALLWNNLQNTGYTNINFVGTLNNSTACGVPFDGDNEGHGGYLATNIANQNLLPGWLSATNPDIVMMHLGTNDVWNNIAPTTILAAYSTLVNQMRANNPNMKILVAQITPMNPSGCSACAQGVINLNAVIPGWASSKSTAQSPIVVVNQWTGYNDSTDTIDGVHPNASGNAKIAAKWYSPLTTQIKSVSGSGGGPTPTPTPGSGGGSFSGNYKLISRNSGQALDVIGASTANGAGVDQWPYGGNANQQWNIVSVGSGYYKLLNRNSGQALDVAGQSTANGALVDQWPDSGTANQQWSIVSVGSGYYKLLSRNSGQALDVAGQSTANGARIDQWPDSGTANQQWTIVQV